MYECEVTFIALRTLPTLRLVVKSHFWLVVMPFATGLRLPGLLSVEVWHGERAPNTYSALRILNRPPRDSNQ